jgi:hypothetical protein
MARYFDSSRVATDGLNTFNYGVVGSQEGDTDSHVRPFGRISGYLQEEENTSFFHRNRDTRQLEPTREWKESMDAEGNAHPSMLFGYTPAKLHISEAFFHPSMRSHAIPLVAKALADYPAAKVVEASADLSKHSSRLVKKAQDMGLPVVPSPHNPDAEVTNDLDFSDSMRFSVGQISDFSTSEIPVSEMKSAMAPVRAHLRANREARVSDKVNNNQFQPHLPGMERF